MSKKKFGRSVQGETGVQILRIAGLAGKSREDCYGVVGVSLEDGEIRYTLAGEEWPGVRTVLEELSVILWML